MSFIQQQYLQYLAAFTILVECVQALILAYNHNQLEILRDPNNEDERITLYILWSSRDIVIRV